MRPRDLPAFEVRTRKLVGSPYTRHALHVNGVEIHSQLSPYGEAEIEDRVRSYLNPKPVQPVKQIWATSNVKHGRPKQRAKPSAGWRDDDLETA